MEVDMSRERVCVLLVNIIDTDKITRNYPVGLYALRSFLQTNHSDEISVEIKDTQLDSIEEIIMFEKQWKPNILGLSASSDNTDMLNKFMSYIDLARLNRRKCLIVFGKQAGTFGFRTLLAKYPDSICVRGEGELALQGLSKFLMGKKPMHEVANIAYLDENTKNIVMTSRKVINCLSALGYTDHSDIKKYVRTSGNAWLEASRGCQWNACHFCSLSEFWGVPKPRREKPLELVIDELLQFDRMGISRLSFTDEDFLNPDAKGLLRAREMALEILKKNIRTSFHADVRAESIWNKRDSDHERKLREETLGLLKRAGLRTVFIGIESGANSQLQRYNKGSDVATAKMAIDVCKRLGVNMALGFIMLEPLASKHEIQKSINFIKQNQILKYISVPSNILRIYPGERYIATIRDEERQIGRRLLSDKFNWSTLTFGITDYKYQSVRTIAEIMEEYTSSQYDMFNSIRWFERFSSSIFGISCDNAYSYIQNASEKLKELQLELLHELSFMTDDELMQAPKVEKVVSTSIDKRNDFIVTFWNEIKQRNHESTCEVILLQLDKYIRKSCPYLLDCLDGHVRQNDNSYTYRL